MSDGPGISWPGERIAMVLAAGRGERMRPLSEVLPKPALPLPGGPVVGWAIRQAARAGARRVVVNSWHLAAQMERALERFAATEVQGPELVISREAELMDTAGGLALAHRRGLLGDAGPLLVLNGDGVIGLDLSALLKRHLAGDDLVTMALLPHLAPRVWSRVLLDGDDHVQRIAPPGAPAPGEVPLLYPGVMLVSREALEGLPVERIGIHQALWQPAMRQGRLGGAVVTGHWREVGTPPAYLEAVLAHLAGSCRIDPGAEVAVGAELVSSLVGAGARIEADARIVSSIVAEGARVGRGARVERSILLGSVVAGPGETVSGQVRARG